SGPPGARTDQMESGRLTVFVQVIKGKVSDPAGGRRQNDRWRKEVQPGATGFLGSTVGVAADGTFIALARFADEAAAKKNSARAEQSAWWADTAKTFDGEPTFRGAADIQTAIARATYR